MDQPDVCQVSHLLTPDEQVAKWMSGVQINRREVHHIFGRKTAYAGYWTNLIVIENAAHDFGHDVSPHCLKLACLISKYQFGIEQMKFAEETGTIIAPPYRHWYLPALDALSSPKCNLLGAVSTLTNNVHGMFSEYRNQLLEVLEG
jgi:hypothetical protein